MYKSYPPTTTTTTTTRVTSRPAGLRPQVKKEATICLSFSSCTRFGFLGAKIFDVTLLSSLPECCLDLGTTIVRRRLCQSLTRRTTAATARRAIYYCVFPSSATALGPPPPRLSDCQNIPYLTTAFAYPPHVGPMYSICRPHLVYIYRTTAGTFPFLLILYLERKRRRGNYFSSSFSSEWGRAPPMAAVCRMQPVPWK